MKKIYKYALPIDGMSIEINDYVLEWLDVKTQDGWPHIWAIVDTERSGMTTEIVAWGTGWVLPDDVYYNTDYLGTAIDGAGYVWHYFAEEKNSFYDNDTITSEWSNGGALTAAPTEWLNVSPTTLDLNLEYLREMLEGACNTATISVRQ